MKPESLWLQTALLTLPDETSRGRQILPHDHDHDARCNPRAAANDEESLAGEEGIIEALVFDTDADEADHIAGRIQEWLEGGVDTAEIAVLVRQQPHLFAAKLGEALTERGISFRNEQARQDLVAEPAAALMFNFLLVVAVNAKPRPTPN